MNFELKKIKLELKVNWKISRNASLYKENFILNYNGFESEIAPNIRYGETPARIQKEFEELKQCKGKIQEHWCNSFKNAVNNVYIKSQSGNDIYSFFNVKKPQEVLTSFSIPIMDINEIESYLNLNNQFDVYKLKITGLENLDEIKEIFRVKKTKLRIDANEGFKSLEEYLEFQEQIKDFNIEFIEQPFSASMVDEYIKLKPQSYFPVIADESVEDDFDGELFTLQFHGINVKLMKAGGLQYAKRLLDKARAYGLKTMIGCMIESSLGISEAYALASLCDYCDLDGALLTKNDPYAYLLNLDKGKLALNN